MIDDSLKPLIIKACYLVAAADNKITQSEKEMLLQISYGLRMSDEEFIKCLEEIHDS